MSEEAPPLPVDGAESKPPPPPDSLPQLSAKRWGMDEGEGPQCDSEAPPKRRRIEESECELLPVLHLQDALASPPDPDAMLPRLETNHQYAKMDFEDLSSDENSLLGLEDGEIEDGEIESTGDTKDSNTDSNPAAVQGIAGDEAKPADEDVAPKEAVEAEEPAKPVYPVVKCHQGPPPPEEALPEVTQMLQAEEEKLRRAAEERKREEGAAAPALQRSADCQETGDEFRQEFIIIDDIEGSDTEKGSESQEGEKDGGKAGTELGADVYDSDYIDEDEIEALLDEDLNNKKQQSADLQNQEYHIREKCVLVDRGSNPFDILPEGWVQVCHHSGMPVYLHKQSRVCTLSRPYFLGPGSVRRHDIPISAVPCLQYRRALEEEKRAVQEGGHQGTAPSADRVSPNLQSNEISQSDNALHGVALETAGAQPGAEEDNLNTNKPTENESKEMPTKERDVDPSVAMLSKLQDELNALAQGSSPSTPRATSPSAEARASEAGKTERQATPGLSDKAGDPPPETAQGNQPAGGKTYDKSSDEARLKAILSGSVALGKKAECPPRSAASKPAPQVKSIEEHRAEQNLSSEQIQQYCEALFEFKKIQVKRFKSWGARHKHRKQAQTAYRNAHSLPSGTQILTCDVTPKDAEQRGGGKRRKQFVLNLKGKNDVCVLHEYAQHVLRVQPSYDFKETSNAEKPFCTTISINGIVYGTGSAASKKLAKSVAARDALNVLIPEVAKIRASEKGGRSDVNNEYAFFDEIKIEDPRILELSAKAGQPLPFSILQECLKRNFGMGDTNIVMDMHIIRPQRSQFTMKVAQYEGKVMCRSKKEGKHMASQQILQKMHPHVKSWGSILRMYARDIEAVKMKQEEEQKRSNETDREKSYEADRERSNETDQERSNEAYRTRSNEANRERSNETDRDRSNEADRERSNETDQERSNETDRERSNETDQERSSEADRERSNETDQERSNEADRERSNEADRERSNETDRERSNEADQERSNEADRDKSNETDRERSNEADRERSNETDRERSNEGDTVEICEEISATETAKLVNRSDIDAKTRGETSVVRESAGKRIKTSSGAEFRGDAARMRKQGSEYKGESKRFEMRFLNQDKIKASEKGAGTNLIKTGTGSMRSDGRLVKASGDGEAISGTVEIMYCEKAAVTDTWPGVPEEKSRRHVTGNVTEDATEHAVMENITKKITQHAVTEDATEHAVMEHVTKNATQHAVMENVTKNVTQHAVTQTDWAGIAVFHKATQFPEQSYAPCSLPQVPIPARPYTTIAFQPRAHYTSAPWSQPTTRRSPPIEPHSQHESKSSPVMTTMKQEEGGQVGAGEGAVPSSNKAHADASSQTESIGFSVTHRATQCPDPAMVAAGPPSPSPSGRCLATRPDTHGRCLTTRPDTLLRLYEGEDVGFLKDIATAAVSFELPSEATTQEYSTSLDTPHPDIWGEPEKPESERRGAKEGGTRRPAEPRGTRGGRDAGASENRNTMKACGHRKGVVVSEGGLDASTATGRPEASKASITGGDKGDSKDEVQGQTRGSRDRELDLHREGQSAGFAVDPAAHGVGYAGGYLSYAAAMPYGYGTSLLQQPYLSPYGFYASSSLYPPLVMSAGRDSLTVPGPSAPGASVASVTAAKAPSERQEAGDDEEGPGDEDRPSFIGPKLPKAWSKGEKDPSSPMHAAPAVQSPGNKPNRTHSAPGPPTSAVATESAQVSMATELAYMATPSVAMVTPSGYGGNCALYPQSGAVYYPTTYAYMYPGWSGYM